jgi:serine/threonine-protein kinase
MSKLSKLLQDSITTPLGSFKLLKILGQGGAGIVFEARKNEKPFAIKFLLESNSKKRERFTDEYLGIMQLLPHGNIARPIHFGEYYFEGESYPYIVMKKYDGTLVRLQEQELASSVTQLAVQLLDGMEHLHANGIIHRDLKPQNIFREHENFVIGDFGIASFDPSLFAKDAATEKGERLANFEFSAPEQAHTVGATPQMDFYAFGQVLQWYCLGSVHKGTARKKLTDFSQELKNLDSVIDKCLRNDPAQRPTSVAEIRNLLSVPSEDEVDESAGLSMKSASKKWDALHVFENVLRKSFPKTTRSHSANRTEECNRLMQGLSEICKSAGLWWMASGYRDMHLERISTLDLNNATWLVNDFEFRVDSVSVFRDDSCYANFVILYTQGSDPFSANDNSLSDEQVGFWRGQYISMAEYTNGYAEVNGQVVELIEPHAEVRSRFIKPQVLLIAPHSSSALHSENQSIVSDFLEALESNWPQDPVAELTAFARKIKRHIDRDVDILR